MNKAFEQFVDALSLENFEILCSAVGKRHHVITREGLPEVLVIEMELFTGMDLDNMPVKCSRQKALKLYKKRTKLPLKDAQRAFGRAIAENCTEYGRKALAKSAKYLAKYIKKYSE